MRMRGTHQLQDFGRAIVLAGLVSLLGATHGTARLWAAETETPTGVAASPVVGEVINPAELVESTPQNAVASELAGTAGAGANSVEQLADGKSATSPIPQGVPLTAPAFAKDSINIEDFYLPEDKPSPKSNAFRIVLAVVALGLCWHFQQHHKRKRRR
jgi:hypothetical protein